MWSRGLEVVVEKWAGGCEDWGCGSVGRVLAWHAQSPGLHSQHFMIWHTLVILASRRWKPKNQKFKIGFSYIAIPGQPQIHEILSQGNKYIEINVCQPT